VEAGFTAGQVSAPKPISLTALVGGDDNVRLAHCESVRVALEQLEKDPSSQVRGCPAIYGEICGFTQSERCVPTESVPPAKM
jgi:hypothetical protein